jgi:hypothetical protein
MSFSFSSGVVLPERSVVFGKEVRAGGSAGYSRALKPHLQDAWRLGKEAER